MAEKTNFGMFFNINKSHIKVILNQIKFKTWK